MKDALERQFEQTAYQKGLSMEDTVNAASPIEASFSGEFNKSGSKYLREAPCAIEGKLDVYAVLDAFNVTCPARQHAIKKLLCSGIRGKGDVIQDLEEAEDAVQRAIQMQKARQPINKTSTSANKEHFCTYPNCNCPFDAPSDPNWCARGYKHKEAACKS